MKREFGVEASVGKPQVAYGWDIRRTVENAEGKFIKQSGGRGSTDTSFCGSIRNRMAPAFEFGRRDQGRVVPRAIHPGGQEGVEGNPEGPACWPGIRWST